MEKILALFLLLSFLLPTRSVFATEDISFATTTLNAFIGVLVKAGKPFGFNITDYVHPVYEGKDKIPTTVYKPFADFKEEFGTRLTPGDLRPNGKIIDWTEPVIWTSLYCAVLKLTHPHGNTPDPVRSLSEGNQVSTEVPDAPRAFQYGMTIGSIIGRFATEPDANGVFDFNRPPIQLGAMSNGDCHLHDEGIAWDKMSNNQVKLSKFGGDAVIKSEIFEDVFDWFEEIIDDAVEMVWKCCATIPDHEVVFLTEKKRTDKSNANCQDSAHPCPFKDIGPESEGLHKTGGWAGAFVPNVITQQEVVPNGGLSYKIYVGSFEAANIKDSDKDFNIGADGQQKAACMAVPAANGTTDFQARTRIGGEVEIKPKCIPPKELMCPIDVIKEKAQKPSDNACAIGGGIPSSFLGGPSDQLPNYPDQKEAYGSGLSPLGIKVLETAADAYHVPASVLLATMLYEGAFNHPGVWDWSSDEKIEEYSDCNKPVDAMPGCSGFAIGSGSKAPFGWIDSRWDAYMTESTNPYVGKNLKVELEGLDEVVKKVKNFNSCNFTDAAFMAARAISEDFSHAITPIPGSCVIPGRSPITMLTDTSLPASCGAWTEARVATTRYNYGGGSTQGTCTAADPANSYNVGYTVDIWNANK